MSGEPLQSTSTNKKTNKKREPIKSFYKGMKWDWCISGNTTLKKNLLFRLFPKVDGRKIDTEEFADLLAWSMSLKINDKKRIIDEWLDLSQEQCDELQATFVSEREEFSKLLHSEKTIIFNLLLENTIQWISLLYGESHMADMILIEACRGELTDIESLPIPEEFFERDEGFYTAVLNILIDLSADKNLWIAAIQKLFDRMGTTKKNTKKSENEAWSKILQNIDYKRDGIERTKHAINAIIHVQENILRTLPSEDNDRKFKLLFSLGINYQKQKKIDEALKLFTAANDIAIEKYSEPQMKFKALIAILNTQSWAIPLEFTERFMNDSIWSIMDISFLPHIYRDLSLNMLFLGQGNLALELMEEYAPLTTDEGGKQNILLDIFSIATYCGDFDRADKYLAQFISEDIYPIIEQLNKDKSSSDEYYYNLAKNSFCLYLACICSNSDNLKSNIDKLYTLDYDRWLTKVVRSEKLQWVEVQFGEVFRQLCNKQVVYPEQLMGNIKYTRDKLFILDNLYVASSFLARRGELQTVMQLSELASAIYSIHAIKLLGQRMPFTKRYAAFTNCDENSPLIYAGHPDELSTWTGTWTLKQFKQMLIEKSLQKRR